MRLKLLRILVPVDKYLLKALTETVGSCDKSCAEYV